MRELDFNLNDNPFINFHTSRYAMSARVNVEKAWKYCKEDDTSFFIMSLGCVLNAVNSVPQLRRRIIDGKVIEYDYLDGVTPIMDEENEIYRILNGKEEAFFLEMEKRDQTNIVNLSCIPWVDFDMLTNCIVDGNAIQPLVTWGKVNENYEMSVSITVSHIFVNGRELGYFYENLQKEFDKF